MPRAIGKLSNLKYLEVIEGKLTRIDTEIQNMTGLLELKMSQNPMYEISRDAFLGLFNLRTIVLSENKLRFLHPGTFYPCQNLTKIFLQKNSINSVEGLFNVSKLQEIYLQENNLKTIDDAFQEKIKLRILNLNSNPLNEIGSSAFDANVENLRILTLSSCRLSFLPPAVFRSLAELERLDLSHNRLESLPLETFHGLARLLAVNLDGNQISTVPEVFRQNHRLRTVLFSHNLLRSVGKIFRGLRSLKNVDLKSNKLRVITETDFSTTTSVRFLQLSHNHIHRIDSNAFVKMARLRNLSLDYNLLVTLNGSLKHSRDLENLKLHHNQLREIGPSEMSNLKKLKILKLSHNNLTNVHKAFKNLMDLNSLSLNNNKLTTISRNTFPRDIKIKEIYVAANPWSCDCRLSWLLEFERLAHQFVCASPPKVRLAQLTLDHLTRWRDNCDRSCECTCVPRKNEFFVRVNCSGLNKTQVPASLPDEVGELHLQNNLLGSLSALNGHSLGRLRYLDAEGNLLARLDFHAPKNLRTLRLARNSLTRASHFPPSVRNWTLADNPWICDSDTYDFWKFLMTHGKKVWDVNYIVCSNKESKPELYGKIISDLTEEELRPEKSKPYIFLAAGLSVLALVGVACHVVHLRYRYHLRVWLYSRGLGCLKRRDDRDSGKKHDAFLCFSIKDDDFVKEYILPELEEREPFYSVFVPPRDRRGGTFELDQQLDEMRNSKRVIIIVSQNFIDNEVCMEIFRTAFLSGLEEKHYRIIPIVVGTLPPLSDLDPSLKVALQTTKSLRFGQKLLWEMVRYAMPDKSPETEGHEDDMDMPLLNAW